MAKKKEKTAKLTITATRELKLSEVENYMDNAPIPFKNKIEVYQEGYTEFDDNGTFNTVKLER